MDLEEYKKQINNLSINDKKLRDLYLRDLALGKVQGPPTGYASIDKPWLKYYSEDHIMADIPHMTAYEYLKLLNKDNLDGIAFDTITGLITYKEFFDTIDNVAASLYACDVKEGKKVLTMLPTLEHEAFLLYGVDKVGGAISYLHPQSSVDDVVDAINDFNVEVFFTFDYLLTPEMEKEIYEKTSVKNIVTIGNMPFVNRDEKTISWNDFMNYGKNIELPEIKRNPEDLLFIAKTGGSTGKPKSVMLNDDSFNIAVHQYLNSDLSYEKNDRWLRLWPLFSATAAVSNNHLPLCAGMNNIIRQFPLNINDFDKIFAEVKPEHLLLIPQLLDVLEKSELLENEDLSYVKTNGCGGLSITSQFEERVNEFHKKHNMDCILGYGWGCTENATSAAMRSNAETTKIGTVGAPQVNTTVAVFDPDTLEEKQFGEEGELCIKSNTQMMGYYNEQALTNSVLKRHHDGEVWLHTGDLGKISDEGIVTVMGRMTRTIFVFPMAKLYPSFVEEAISKVPGVFEVAVGEIPDKEHEGFGLPVCFVVPEEGASEEKILNDIDELCTNSLPEYAKPNSIHFRESFPRTVGDKTDVRALVESLEKARTLKKERNAK